MQTPYSMSYGATGITIPRIPRWHPTGAVGTEDNILVQPLVRIPTIAATVVTLEVSVDSGGTWSSVGKDAYGRQAFPTANSYTGDGYYVLEPMLPDMKLRATLAGTPPAAVAASLTTNMSNSNADITLTAVTAGHDGNLISVTYADPGGTTLKARSCTVSNTDITVNLDRCAQVQATKTIGGILYTAKSVGAAGNSISVTATAGGAGKSLSVTATGTDITLQYGTTARVKASKTIGGLLYTAATSGVSGNNISITATITGTGASLAVTVATNDITLAYKTDGAGAIISTAASVIAAFVAATAADALVKVSGTGTPVVAAHTHLEGGSDGGVINSTAAQVSAAAVAATAVNALVSVGTTGTPAVATKTSLAGGVTSAITSTAAQLKALINTTAAAAALVSAEDESTGSGIVNAVAKAYLTNGDDACPQVFFGY